MQLLPFSSHLDENLNIFDKSKNDNKKQGEMIEFSNKPNTPDIRQTLTTILLYIIILLSQTRELPKSNIEINV